jgi:predicted Na+-dependent transporter
MIEILQTVLSVSVLAFAVCSMLAVGLAYTVQQLLAPLREPTAVIRALIANFVLVPMLAVGLARLLPITTGVETGIILLGCAAGAPFLIKLAYAANSDVALSGTLLVLLVPVSVIFMPLVVPWLAPAAHVSPGPIATQLAATLMVPLVIGLVVRARSPRWAERLRPLMGTASTVALILLFAATLAIDLPNILALGGLAVIAAVALVLGAFAIGYALARPGRGRRTVLALGTGQRGVSAALLVASRDIRDPDALVMVVLVSVIGMIVLFPLARWRRTRQGQGFSTGAAKLP